MFLYFVLFCTHTFSISFLPSHIDLIVIGWIETSLRFSCSASHFRKSTKTHLIGKLSISFESKSILVEMCSNALHTYPAALFPCFTLICIFKTLNNDIFWYVGCPCVNMCAYSFRAEICRPTKFIVRLEKIESNFSFELCKQHCSLVVVLVFLLMCAFWIIYCHLLSKARYENFSRKLNN